MPQPLTFQQVILKLHAFWSEQGCIIWEPYNIQVGAGTNNPATTLRVLGPEPWRVAYVEPSVRPDDGRFGENPNRMQKYYQYQVILKPDPGNPQELYLQSLEALGINPREHDIRFVEDNWESPALGAWGLGWEVWLDGQEITQFTYFQQAGGIELNPISVEITYGVERIVLALQNKDSAWAIDWLPGLTYREMMYTEEVEHCKYYFDIADVENLRRVYDIYERESQRALEQGAIIAAYDYVLKCSHLFNVLDTRGAIGVTERAAYFNRMRNMTRNTAKAYAEKREQLGYPLLQMRDRWPAPAPQTPAPMPPSPTAPADVLLEIGVEEMPADDISAALSQLREKAAALFHDLRLTVESVAVFATPRRLTLVAKQVAPRQSDETIEVKGPPASRAYDADGKPTVAAIGFARGQGVALEDLTVQTLDGGEYVVAKVTKIGQPAPQALAQAFADLVASIKFGKTMRWNATDVSFSRPIRWIIALFGDAIIPFSYGGVASGRVTRGLRPLGSPEIAVNDAAHYLQALASQGILLDPEARQQAIAEQIKGLADAIGGRIPKDASLLAEVTNLVERPTALRGAFDAHYLQLPREVLITVMREHQRYFPIEDKAGQLLPYFIAVRNGDSEHLEKVVDGNEHVLRARFSDAAYFFKEDIKKPLAQYLPRLSTLTFQVKLGSMLDKNNRVAGLVDEMGALLLLEEGDIATAKAAAAILKADLATQMVVELTSLQGVMGREYALREGYPKEVANAIYEHWLPRGAGDDLPSSNAGILLALLDRLDSLVGLFAAGLAPKSTADPFGLRRAALGIIQILAHHSIDLDLRVAIESVAKAQPIPVEDEVKAQILEFIKGRLLAWIIEEYHYPRDIINALVNAQAHNPARVMVGILQLKEWVKRDDWEHILDGFARCVRITRVEPYEYPLDADLLTEPAEKALYQAYLRAIETLDEDDNVDGFLAAFTPLLPFITDFFDNVLVHTEDANIRRNRLALLQAISRMAKERADLSELSGF